MGQNKSKWIVIFGMILVCFILIPVGLLVTQPPPANSENCRLDGEIPAHTVVLIDQSDPFKESDVEWVWSLVFDEAQAIKKYGRLTVLGIDKDNADEGIEVFSRCSPGSPRSANPIFENPEFIAQDWKLKFENNMKAEVETLLLQKQSPVSPLVEHVKGIVRRVDFRPEVTQRRIVLISDLYQNSDLYSMYNSGLRKEEFLERLHQIEFPILEGVEIAFFRVDRKRSIRGSDLITFWETVFSEYQAQNLEVIRE